MIKKRETKNAASLPAHFPWSFSCQKRHKITSWAALTQLVGDHVGDFAWVVSLSGILVSKSWESESDLKPK